MPLPIQVTMRVVPSDEQYAQIVEKVKKRLRYERFGEFNIFLFFVYLIVPSLIVLPLTALWNIQLGIYGSPILGTCGIILAFGIVVLVQRRLKEYPIDDDEWAIYYVRPLYTNLAKYVETKPSEGGMRKDYRKKALKCAEGLLSCVQERWKVGTFKPIKEYEKGAVSELEQNLRYRIIPAIKGRDDELVKKVETIMYNFLAYAQSLHIEDIKSLNERIIAPDIGLPDRKPLKIGYIARFLGFLKSHKAAQHLLAMSSIGVACVIFGYVLLVNWELPKESVLSDTIILLGILIGAYVTIQWSTNR
jgi:hypothetical protein